MMKKHVTCKIVVWQEFSSYCTSKRKKLTLIISITPIHNLCYIINGYIIPYLNSLWFLQLSDPLLLLYDIPIVPPYTFRWPVHKIFRSKCVVYIGALDSRPTLPTNKRKFCSYTNDLKYDGKLDLFIGIAIYCVCLM